MDEIFSLRETLEYLERRWPTPLGLALAIAALVGVCATASAFIPKTWVAFAFCLGVVAVAGVWFFARRIPKCPNGRVGFVIAIECENEEIRGIFRSDFVWHLRVLLSEGVSADRFWIYEMPEVRGVKVDTADDARALRERMDASFVLFGRVRTRGSGSRKRIVDLHGLVSHAPLGGKTRAQLEREFSELLPRRLIAEAGSELPGFELGSSLADLAARYIIGIAAECSNDLDYAERLFLDAEKRARDLMAVAAPFARKVLDRVPWRLSEIAIARAKYEARRWRISRDDAQLTAAFDLLQAAPPVSRRMHEWSTLMAIYEVVRNDNYTAAIGLLSATDPGDPVTKMNMAFLESTRGNLKVAARNYRIAAKIGVDLGAAEEVMSFLDWYRDSRPNLRAEISFDLGFIAYAILKDREIAKMHFNEFVNADVSGRYRNQQQLVGKWLDELSCVGTTA